MRQPAQVGAVVFDQVDVWIAGHRADESDVVADRREGGRGVEVEGGEHAGAATAASVDHIHVTRPSREGGIDHPLVVGRPAGKDRQRVVARDLPLIGAVPIHQPDLKVAGAVRGIADQREEDARLAVDGAHQIVGQHVRDAREGRGAAAITLAELRGAGRVEHAGIDDEVLPLLVDLERQDELRIGRFGQIGAGRNVRRNRSDGEDAGVGQVARQRGEERRVDGLQRQRRIGSRHGDARDRNRFVRIDGRLDLRLRGKRQCGDHQEKGEQ